MDAKKTVDMMLAHAAQLIREADQLMQEEYVYGAVLDLDGISDRIQINREYQWMASGVDC